MSEELINYQKVIPALNKKFKGHIKFEYELARNWVKILPWSKYITTFGGLTDEFYEEVKKFLKAQFGVPLVMFNNAGNLMWW